MMIELLLVLSVVLVLSGIALQSYGGTRINAEVARTLSELRAIASAIESYTLDHNHRPRMAHFDFYGDPALDVVDGEPVRGIMASPLSTPIAYLQEARLPDPFGFHHAGVPLDQQYYTYQDLEAYRDRKRPNDFWIAAVGYYGPWRLGSIGPDREFDHFAPNGAQLPYDPTNGLLSLGNLWRSQLHSDHRNQLPPIPDLLPEH